MYIKYKDIKYSCGCNISRQSITYTRLPEDFPVPVEGEITLCADNDFVMRIDNAADYLRQTFVNGTLTLTNLPEPVEPDEPTEPEAPEGDLEVRVTAIEEAIKKGLSL